MDNRLAVIDLGSNTFHLLIVDLNLNKSNFTEVYRERVFVYLANEGFGSLSEDKKELALNTLQYFKRLCNQFNVGVIKTVATEAFRKLENNTEVVSYFQKETEIDIEIIDGLREAELIYKGNDWCLELPQRTLILDIGGGSVELITVSDGLMKSAHSFQIGISHLRSAFPLGRISHEERILEMSRHIQKALTDELDALHSMDLQYLLGASGPFEILEKLEGLKPAHFKGNLISVPQSRSWIDLILSKEKEDRFSIANMPQNRADLSLESMLIIREVLNRFNKISNLVISPYSLKEGLIAEHYFRLV